MPFARVKRGAHRALAPWLMVVALAAPAMSAAQSSTIGVPFDAAGGELARELRFRGLGPGGARSSGITIFNSGLDPWAQPATVLGQGFYRDDAGRLRIYPIETGLIANSGYAAGRNDGPVWAGRGLTAVVNGGAALRYGRLTVMLRPTAFVAENAAFPTSASGSATADWLIPDGIDRPQRFGSGVYARIDPGESEISVRLGAATIGVSSRLQTWGPAIDGPLLLGNNAAGIPRAFVATREPVGLGPLHFQGEIMWGWLSGSGYENRALPARMLTAAVGGFGVDGIPGLELGAIRMFHVERSGAGVGTYLRVFQGLLKSSIASSSNPTGDSDDNQLAGVFVRWAPPGGRVELYGEYGREDHSWNLRDFFIQPDHDAGFVLGLVRSFGDTANPTVLRAEHLNTRLSHLGVSLEQTPWYVHTGLRQGHTQRGQVLGAASGLGGGGTSLVLDRYQGRGRTSVRWDRMMMGEWRGAGGLPDASRADVVQSLGIERVTPSRRGEVTASLSAMMELNRYFASDRFNLAASIGYRFAPRR